MVDGRWPMAASPRPPARSLHLGGDGQAMLSANGNRPSADAMIEVRVAHLGLDRATNSPVVILQERDGERVLPIWIGPNEASAIAMQLAGVKFARPLTHDLIRQVIQGLGADLRRVTITQVKDNTYFAELFLHRDDHVIQIDARPSDSIAVALRLNAPIFTSDELLERSSVETIESSDAPQPLDADQLKTYLENLDPEDFGKFMP
jgi:bifunctional DNase/RNase